MSDLAKTYSPSGLITGAYDVKLCQEAYGKIQEIQDIMHDAWDVVNSSTELSVINDETSNLAAERVSTLAKCKKKLEALRKYFVGPLNEKVDTVNDAFKIWTAPSVDCEKRLRKEAEDYFIKKQDAAREEAAKREREQAAREKAARALGGAAPKPIEHPAIQEPIKTTRTDAGTLTMKMVLDFEVTHPSQVPQKYWIIDESAIRKAVVRDGVKDIPGVRIFQKPQSVAK